jgi:hypothetical protein
MVSWLELWIVYFWTISQVRTTIRINKSVKSKSQRLRWEKEPGIHGSVLSGSSLFWK